MMLNPSIAKVKGTEKLSVLGAYTVRGFHCKPMTETIFPYESGGACG